MVIALKKLDNYKTVEIIISELDLFIIDKVRELRGNSKNYISQVELSQRMGFAEGYVGKVENFSSSTRYNIRKIHLIARALELTSYTDLLPTNILRNDMLLLKLKVNKQRNDTVTFDGHGNVVKNYIIENKKILSEKEIKDYNNRRLKR